MNNNTPIHTLCIESSTKNCSLAIFKNDELLCLCEETDDNYSHAEKLHLFIQWALEGAEITIDQLNAISVGKGPGSYTGLRIGIAAAKGLCFSLQIPLIALNSLHLLIEKAKTQIQVAEYDLIVPMIDARRMEVYTTLYDIKKGELSAIEAKIIEPNSYKLYETKKILFIGNGVEKCKSVLDNKNFTFILDQNPSANEMGQMTWQKFKQKEFEDIAYFEPLYLKDFIVEKPKKKPLQ